MNVEFLSLSIVPLLWETHQHIIVSFVHCVCPTTFNLLLWLHSQQNLSPPPQISNPLSSLSDASPSQQQAAAAATQWVQTDFKLFRQKMQKHNLIVFAASKNMHYVDLYNQLLRPLNGQHNTAVQRSSHNGKHRNQIN